MRAVADVIDGFNDRIGRFVAWFAVLIVLIQFLVVLGRYVFGIGSIWAQESIVYLHGFMFMLAAAYTLKDDRHVRVDIFYREARPTVKAWVNLIGTIVFVLPISLLIVWVSWDYVARSWSVLEGSRETSGIQGVFLLKTVIIVFAVQMALQGVSLAVHSLLAIGGDEDELNALCGDRDR